MAFFRTLEKTNWSWNEVRIRVDVVRAAMYSYHRSFLSTSGPRSNEVSQTIKLLLVKLFEALLSSTTELIASRNAFMVLIGI